MFAFVDQSVVLYHNGQPIAADEWKILRLVDYWQFFISPTFADLGTRSGRIERVNNWLRWVARQGNTSKRYLIYVVRWELGEIGGRPHCHLFVGGMKNVGNPISMGFILAADWRKRHRSRIDVRVFDRGRLRKGANYLGGDTDWGKNRYEIGKFSTADKVYFSRHAEEILLQMSGPAIA